MTVIELPDDLAAALKAKAEAQHLKLEDWFRTLADAPASGGNDLDACSRKFVAWRMTSISAVMRLRRGRSICERLPAQY
jgi:hypothetical protein